MTLLYCCFCCDDDDDDDDDCNDDESDDDDNDFIIIIIIIIIIYYYYYYQIASCYRPCRAYQNKTKSRSRKLSLNTLETLEGCISLFLSSMSSCFALHAT